MFNSITDVFRHPVVALRFRREAVDAVMAKRQCNRWKARDILDDATDAEIAYALTSAQSELGLALPPEINALITTGEGRSAIGDGTIIQAIIAYFKAHPEIISAAVAFLMTLIGL